MRERAIGRIGPQAEQLTDRQTKPRSGSDHKATWAQMRSAVITNFTQATLLITRAFSPSSELQRAF
eukprot:scaffold35720_cov14-Prasinocladus_malaysianus.AAC.1